MFGTQAHRKQVVFGGRRIAPAAAALIVLLLFAGWGCASSGQQLVVGECDSGKVLLKLEVKPGTDFSIWFLHSYDKAPFEEHYRVLGDGYILLTHMTFKSSLNGQGFALGTYHAKPGGSAELADINQKNDQVIFRLGSPDLANHALMIDGRRVRLLDYANAGTLLCLRVRSFE